MFRATSAAPRRRASNEELLTVHRPDFAALVVRQHRTDNRARNMVLGKLALAAHVDDRVVAVKLRQCLLGLNDAVLAPHRAAVLRFVFSSGCRCGHTLSSMRGCAEVFGWIRSGWKLSSDSAKPSSRKGAYATRVSFATDSKV